MTRAFGLDLIIRTIAALTGYYWDAVEICLIAN
jgi:hypothetical protein